VSEALEDEPLSGRRDGAWWAGDHESAAACPWPHHVITKAQHPSTCLRRNRSAGRECRKRISG